MKFIIEEGIIMIPALYIIGAIIKHTDIMANKWIPLTLLIISLILTPLVIGGYTPYNIIQSILVAGVTVFGDQIIKQSKVVR